MRVANIAIDGVGGIDSLSLAFDPRVNIICGPNGIGKTTIIESIAHLFSSGPTGILKRSANHEKSHVAATVFADGAERSITIDFKEFLPSQKASINGLHDIALHLLSLKINRTFDYRPLEAVGRDTEKSAHTSYTEARDGVSLKDVKNWFVNRYLYSKHDTLTDNQIENFELARSSFSALNSGFTFSRVDPSTNEILVHSPTGEIYYEYLSSGFKSCLSIIFGIIKEVEYRFSSSKIAAKNFDGVVLIDEIELHLHPEWQTVILSVLVERFPNAQFICTTHSPHVIQAAESSQIVAIERTDCGVRRRPLPKSVYGFKGWTVEEILTDVMGMQDLRTPEYRTAIKQFEAAIDMESEPMALAAYETLAAMLHPESVLRKMLRLQLIGVRGYVGQ